MEEACEATDGSMAAMIGGDAEAVRKLAAEVDVDVANFNAPGQIVVSGSTAGIEKAIAGAKPAGIRMGKKLKVAGAYHSRLMDSARLLLAARRQLIYTERNVAEIAYHLGFSDPSYFTRFFKRATSLTPAEFRRRSGTVNN